MADLGRSIKRRFTGDLARLWRRSPLSAEALLASSPRRILLVRQHNQMGDMVCATPTFRSLRETWPEVRTIAHDLRSIVMSSRFGHASRSRRRFRAHRARSTPRSSSRR